MHARSLIAAALGLAAAVTLWIAPTPVARAGSCPTCTSSADCGAGNFCVLHMSDVGCGGALMLCCPGQGCNTFSGRPSCEGTTCTVVEDLVDAGVAATDAGSTATDAGTVASPDAGGGATDAGAATSDGGGVVADAGGTTGMTADDGGCGCRTTGARTTHGWLGGALGGLLLVSVLARKRRSARTLCTGTPRA